MTDQTRLAEIRARVEAAKGAEITDECFRDHYPFVQFSEELLDLVASLTAERDAARDRAMGHQVTIEALQHTKMARELAHLRAVVEEARDTMADRQFDGGAGIWAEEFIADIITALDRGLKGSGE